ncbi:MAG TPA: alpha-amylase family glycosyl hydrolase, partial [Deinococcales bacterium]|nr:alpha-amylase family glycosyl hydrolase [Deinococcales bacterium]
ERLPYLAGLGVNTVELLPLAATPGSRTWGYDGVQPYAVNAAFGRPEDLAAFANAAHAAGLAVVLDLVQNHLGPEGNYLRDFARAYFTDRHHTPWGEALNYAVPEVRDFFIGCAGSWLGDYHLDGLRLDATHEIFDDGPAHVLQELQERVRAAVGRPVILMAEDDRNWAALTKPSGLGLDAQWADDLHHQLHVAATGEREGYYANYSGTPEDIVTTLLGGWFYRGQAKPSDGQPRGTDPSPLPYQNFIVALQNHDQVGNRPAGDRLNRLVSPAAYRALSAFSLFAPETPLLFQGQEWAAGTPFQYFTDFPEELGRLVTAGRRKEFAHFAGFSDPGKVPDPQAESTFLNSKLDWSELDRPGHSGTLALYRDLLRLRAEHPALASQERGKSEAAVVDGHRIVVTRSGGGRKLRLTFGLNGRPSAGGRAVLDSSDAKYTAPGVGEPRAGAVIEELG